MRSIPARISFAFTCHVRVGDTSGRHASAGASSRRRYHPRSTARRMRASRVCGAVCMLRRHRALFVARDDRSAALSPAFARRRAHGSRGGPEKRAAARPRTGGSHRRRSEANARAREPGRQRTLRPFTKETHHLRAGNRTRRDDDARRKEEADGREEEGEKRRACSASDAVRRACRARLGVRRARRGDRARMKIQSDTRLWGVQQKQTLLNAGGTRSALSSLFVNPKRS